jgi:hypothetical protein
MKENLRVSWENLPLESYGRDCALDGEERWIPSPKWKQAALSVRNNNMNTSGLLVREDLSDIRDPDRRVVPLNSRTRIEREQTEPVASCDDVRLGFAGPDDRLISLNVPEESEAGQAHPLSSFDIEYDPEHPDRLIISLLGLDQDEFIYTVKKSIPFPARLIAELLSNRRATAQEIAAWQAISDEDG